MAGGEFNSAVSRGVRAVFESGPVAGLTDAQLLDRFINRRDADGSGFQALLTRHGPMVLGVCRDVLRDEHAAADAFQATFLVLVRKARSVRVEDSLGRWLHGVAWKVAVRARADASRRARVTPSRVDALESIAAPETHDADRADQKAALHEELARLPEPIRAAIVLCHLEGMTHEEAAQRLGWPVGTVRSRLARGRDRLRTRLTRRGLAPALGVAALAGESPAAVNSKLAALTVQAAIALAQGHSSMIAGSVMQLTQGVLMSMLFTKLKMAGALLLASGLIAVGGAGVHAARQAAADHENAPKSRPEQTGTDAAEARDALAWADRMLKQGFISQEQFQKIWQRYQPIRDQAQPAADQEAKPRPLAQAVPANLPQAVEGQMGPGNQPAAPTWELGARLKIARERMAIATQMHKIARMSALELSDAVGQVEIIQGQIAGLRGQLEEEMELLKVRQDFKDAGVKAAEARLKSAQIHAEDAQRLRKQAVISNQEAAKSQSVADERNAELSAAQAELKEVGIRIYFVGQRLKQLDRITRTEAADPAAKPK